MQRAAKLIRNNVIAGCVALGAATNVSYSKNLDAGFVLNEMNNDQQVSYVEGIIDGLAYARFLRDRPDQSGYKCIINWHQTEPRKKWRLTREWLKRHPDKPTPVLIYQMTKKVCGE